MIHITFDKTKKKKKKATAREYSKRVLSAMIIMWFVGAVIGLATVVVQLVRCDTLVSLSELLMYIGAPMTGGIVSYMLKSAFENKEKIKYNYNGSDSI